MVFKRVNNRIADIFIGEGWDKWFRIDTKAKRILASNVPNPSKYHWALLSGLVNKPPTP